MEKFGKKTIKVAIHQPGYHRYCGYFYKMLLSDVFISLDTVQFVRREWQSRQRFYYQGRYKWLTVPVEKGRDTIINKRIANTMVLKDHWEYLKFVYHKTPYFAKYASILEDVYKRQWVYLNDLCVELTLLAKSILDIPAEFVKDSDYPSDSQANFKKVDLLIYCIRKVVDVEEYDEVVYLPRASPIPEDFYLNQKFGNSNFRPPFVHPLGLCGCGGGLGVVTHLHTVVPK